MEVQLHVALWNCAYCLYPLGAVIQPSKKKGVFRHHSVATAVANLHIIACILPSKMYKTYGESKAVQMHAMKANRELKEWFQLFLTSAIDGVSVSFMLQGKGTLYPLNRSLGGSLCYFC